MRTAGSRTLSVLLATFAVAAAVLRLTAGYPSPAAVLAISAVAVAGTCALALVVPGTTKED